jgi:hypothetical protein
VIGTPSFLRLILKLNSSIAIECFRVIVIIAYCREYPSKTFVYFFIKLLNFSLSFESLSFERTNLLEKSNSKEENPLRIKTDTDSPC